MKIEIPNRVSDWLRQDGRADLANLREVDVPDGRYVEVYAEAEDQHPLEDAAMLRDRTLFRILTHHEWGYAHKPTAVVKSQKFSRVARYLWAVLVLILLLLLVIGRARGQEKPKVVYRAQGDEHIEAEKPKPLASPALTPEQKFKIRDLQHKYDELRLQMAKLEMDKLKLEKQLGDALSQLNGVAYDIARESKVPTDLYNLNVDSLQWEKRK